MTARKANSHKALRASTKKQTAQFLSLLLCKITDKKFNCQPLKHSQSLWITFGATCATIAQAQYRRGIEDLA